MKVGQMDQEKNQKKKKKPSNNLDPERSVGSINYELKIRGAKQLKAASSAHVKSKGASLIQDTPLEPGFIKTTGKDGDFTM